MVTPVVEYADRYFQSDVDRIAVLGAISMQWSTLENSLFQIFLFLVPVDIPTAETIYHAYGSHHTKREVIRKLVEHTVEHEATKETFKSLIVKIKNCAGRRNSLMHDIWVKDDTSNEILLMKSGYVPAGQDDLNSETVKSLLAFHKKLHRLNTTLAMSILLLVAHGPRSITAINKKKSARQPKKLSN